MSELTSITSGLSAKEGLYLLIQLFLSSGGQWYYEDEFNMAPALKKHVLVNWNPYGQFRL